jgi:predicted nucleic acid-binding protein
VDHLRGDQRARDLLRHGFASGRLVASVLTRAEVIAGMRTHERSATHDLLTLFEWIPVDQDIADHAGHTARRYLRSHPGVDPVDFVIAATTERLGAELWTRNRKHFPMLPALPDPYALV